MTTMIMTGTIYDEDDDYADGVDDAIDEMMEEGEGDW